MPQLNRFYSPREGANLWARSEHNIAAWLRGDQFDVDPVTLEYAPILACNADCPLCPYKKSRDALCKGLIPASAFAVEDGIASSTRAIAQTVLSRARDSGVLGVLFTGGGEPLKWALLLEMLAYSLRLGMVNGLYTNGLEIATDPDLAAGLMSPASGLAFLRMSINTTSRRATSIHWGLELEEIDNQWIALARLIEARDRLFAAFSAAGKPIPSIQVSTIVDKNTVGDLPEICERLAAVMARRVHGGPADVLAVRPLTIHGRKMYSAKDHEADVIAATIRACGVGSAGQSLLAAQGVRLFLGFGLDAVASGAAASYSELVQLEYSRRRVSLANGVFLTVGPGGSVYPSTEYNCKEGWSLGNLMVDSVSSIWGGPRRRAVLEHFNQHNWGPSVAQPTARTNRLDKIADAVRTGKMSPDDVAAIREASYSSPALLLD